MLTFPLIYQVELILHLCYANKKLNNLNTISCGFENISEHHQYDETNKINIIAKDLEINLSIL